MMRVAGNKERVKRRLDPFTNEDLTPLLENLFFEPFYQMMRLQFLAAAMEKPVPGENGGEMNADIVSVLHISPFENIGFRYTVTYLSLKKLGNNI